MRVKSMIVAVACIIASVATPVYAEEDNKTITAQPISQESGVAREERRKGEEYLARIEEAKRKREAQLAEYFDVTESFIALAMWYYQNGNLLVHK